jgi:hypothetical protein
MALSNISKEHSNNLLCSINSKELQSYSNIQKIRTNNVAYAKLKMLAKQINALQQEAQNVISETLEIQDLNNIKCSFKKYPGNTYYLYQKINGDSDTTDNRYFSLLSPNEWDYEKTTMLLGEYYYDYDLTLNKV